MSSDINPRALTVTTSTRPEKRGASIPYLGRANQKRNFATDKYAPCGCGCGKKAKFCVTQRNGALA